MPSAITVVLDESCASLKDAVADFAPVEVFRRSGGFLSDARTAAEELHQMLADRFLLGRAIYVAPSFAGFTALLAASRYHGSFAGIVLLDPSHPRQGEEALRILRDVPPSPELERLRALLAGFGPVWEQSCRDVSAVGSLGDLELCVLVGGKFDLGCQLPEDIQLRLIQGRHAMLSEYHALSSKSAFEVVKSAGHDLCRDTPEIVIRAIKHVFDVCIRAQTRAAVNNLGLM